MKQDIQIEIGTGVRFMDKAMGKNSKFIENIPRKAAVENFPLLTGQDCLAEAT